tara:strand:+ start:1257 stop:1583 length:327 start_codon:yes stop_codon:yes gene_type:complete
VSGHDLQLASQQVPGGIAHQRTDRTTGAESEILAPDHLRVSVREGENAIPGKVPGHRYNNPDCQGEIGVDSQCSDVGGTGIDQDTRGAHAAETHESRTFRPTRLQASP